MYSGTVDYETIKKDVDNCNNYTDVYIINENSHNIFYLKGIKIEDKIYYTDTTEKDTAKVNEKSQKMPKTSKYFCIFAS